MNKLKEAITKEIEQSITYDRMGDEKDCLVLEYFGHCKHCRLNAYQQEGEDGGWDYCCKAWFDFLYGTEDIGGFVTLLQDWRGEL